MPTESLQLAAFVAVTFVAFGSFSGGPINGPWDAIVLDDDTIAELFFTNVLNGVVAANGRVVNQATVVRMLLSVSTTSMPQVVLTTVIGSGLPARTDPAALVIGPTGLALSGSGDRLFVNDSLKNRITAISNPLFRTTSAGKGVTISQGKALVDPLGLTIAPNGDLIAANGGNGNLVEVTARGRQIATKLVDTGGGPPPGADDLFGIVAVRAKFTSWTRVRIRLTCGNRPEISRHLLKRRLRRSAEEVRGRLAPKSVPCAVRRGEVGRILRISFQFLPELQDVVIDCP